MNWWIFAGVCVAMWLLTPDVAQGEEVGSGEYARRLALAVAGFVVTGLLLGRGAAVL